MCARIVSDQKTQSNQPREKVCKMFIGATTREVDTLCQKSQKCVKCAHIVSRRRHYSLAKRIIRRWSGAYFTYSAFLKIRKCRSKRVFNRVCRSIRLVHHWRIWIFVSQRARHYALALVRSAPKNQRQQLIRYWGSVRFCKFPMPSKQCRVDVAGV